MLGRALVQEFMNEALTAWDRAELDITDAAAVRDKIAKLRPEVIVNAAAYTSVDEAEGNRELAFAVNANAVGYIAAAAKEIGSTLVHYSTDYVFGGDNSSGYREDDQPGPAMNVYGESKLAGEQALAPSGARFFLVRTAWLYGVGGKNFVDTMLGLGQETDPLRVVNDQHGSPTFTRDVARSTRQIISDKSFAPGIYHVVNAGVATWYDLAVEIMKIAKKSTLVVPVSSHEYPRRARRPAYSILRNTRGPKMRAWREAVKEYIKEKPE